MTNNEMRAWLFRKLDERFENDDEMTSRQYRLREAEIDSKYPENDEQA